MFTIDYLFCFAMETIKIIRLIIKLTKFSFYIYIMTTDRADTSVTIDCKIIRGPEEIRIKRYTYKRVKFSVCPNGPNGGFNSSTRPAINFRASAAIG